MKEKNEFYSMKQLCFPFVLATFLFFWIGCSDEEKVIIPVPEIAGLESVYTVLEGGGVELTPVITNDDDAVYRWTLDGKVVAITPGYLFNAE